jgi:cytochrome c oxidase subunit II
MKSHIHIFAAVLLLAVLALHGPAQSTLNPAGPAARSLSGVSWFVYILFIVVAVVMWALIWLMATRRRGTLDEHAPVDVGGGQSWVLIGGFIIPTIILAVIFILGLSIMRRFPIHDQNMDHEAAPEIRLTGRQWWWEARYLGDSPDMSFTTANEIHIPVGRPVNIELSSADVIHSFWVPNLSGKVDLIPGQVNRMRIEADRPGVYDGKCAEYCGEQHAHMMIVVVAQPDGEYAAWRARQLEPASTPVSAQEMRGAALFLERPCALCHTIRGTPARGSVAPDLTHLALRRGIAANSLANDQANLAAWATHAQSLKPGSAMPNVTQFSGEELQALVAYLRQLR